MLVNSIQDSNNSDYYLTKVLPWILRIGVAGCFIGHGAFGIITKSAWLPYFAVAGIGEDAAWPMMPIVGTMDIAMGILALLWPCRALYIWAVLWAAWTALLRPLSGEPVWEFIERAGNYGVPFAILVVVGTSGSLFARLPSAWPNLDDLKRGQLMLALRATTLALLVGHAGLGLFTQKAGLAHHYAALGFENAESLVPLVGCVEFFIVAIALMLPRAGIFVGICIWKIATESLFFVSGAPFWEVIERFGSYTAPLALALLIWQQQSETETELEPVAA